MSVTVPEAIAINVDTLEYSETVISSPISPKSAGSHVERREWFKEGMVKVQDRTTVSHVWGPVFNAFDGQTTVLVRSAKKLAVLKELATEKDAWIDIYDINQNDEKIKCAQVEVMGDVYYNSECTIMYLEQNDYKLYCDVIDAMKEYLTNDNETNKSNLIAAEKAWKDGEYMSRVWTFQEQLLSRSTVAMNRQNQKRSAAEEMYHLMMANQNASRSALRVLSDFFACVMSLREAMAMDELSVSLSGTGMNTYGRLRSNIMAIASRGFSKWMKEITEIQQKDTYNTELFQNWYVWDSLSSSRRTCSVPHDLVYGVMAALGVLVDVDYKKPFEDVFAEFHAKLIMAGKATVYRGLKSAHVKEYCWSSVSGRKRQTLQDMYGNIMTCSNVWRDDWGTPTVPKHAGTVSVVGKRLVFEDILIAPIAQIVIHADDEQDITETRACNTWAIDNKAVAMWPVTIYLSDRSCRIIEADVPVGVLLPHSVYALAELARGVTYLVERGKDHDHVIMALVHVKIFDEDGRRGRLNLAGQVSPMLDLSKFTAPGAGWTALDTDEEIVLADYLSEGSLIFVSDLAPRKLGGDLAIRIADLNVGATVNTRTGIISYGRLAPYLYHLHNKAISVSEEELPAEWRNKYRGYHYDAISRAFANNYVLDLQSGATFATETIKKALWVIRQDQRWFTMLGCIIGSKHIKEKCSIEEATEACLNTVVSLLHSKKIFDDFDNNFNALGDRHQAPWIGNLANPYVARAEDAVAALRAGKEFFLEPKKTGKETVKAPDTNANTGKEQQQSGKGNGNNSNNNTPPPPATASAAPPAATDPPTLEPKLKAAVKDGSFCDRTSRTFRCPTARRSAPARAPKR
ncbi:hypothetical protein HDU96_002240, partial [Phlyctochytrium bullatum]